MSFSEFYCQTTGSNLNAGSTTSDAASVTETNGDWGNAAANRFTAASGTPFSGVLAGEWASVYLDGATVAVYIAQVTGITGGGAGVNLSSTIKMGTAPATGATGRSIKIGGAWKGPNGAEAFPFGFVQALPTGTDPPRVNLKAGTNYAITAAMTQGNTGPIYWRGYTATIADGGKAQIDGGTSGASYILLTASGRQNTYIDLIFANNGATGSAAGVSATADDCLFRRCVFHDLRGGGLLIANGYGEECEAYACNQSNTATTAAFSSQLGNLAVFKRCIAHDNTGSNTSGFTTGTASGDALECSQCIADSNGSHGFLARGRQRSRFFHCDAYNNGGDGIRISIVTTGGAVFVENCNLVKNGGYGINRTDTLSNLFVVNCGFGSGTMANTSGQTNGMSGPSAEGSVTYASNSSPWADADNGDFRISLAGAKGAGRASFTETAASYTGTVGYPDIGAAQHLESGSGSNLSKARIVNA